MAQRLICEFYHGDGRPSSSEKAVTADSTALRLSDLAEHALHPNDLRSDPERPAAAGLRTP